MISEWSCVWDFRTGLVDGRLLYSCSGLGIPIPPAMPTSMPLHETLTLYHAYSILSSHLLEYYSFLLLYVLLIGHAVSKTVA